MNILAIGSHPDDLEYGCGGTLLKLSKREETNLYYLVATHGDNSGRERANVRIKEQEDASAFIGAKKVYWGGFMDTQLTTGRELIGRIEEVIEECKPDIIFVNYPEDVHQDHRHLAESTIVASRNHQKVIFYEDYKSIGFNPTLFVDITDVLDEKIKLLRFHKSQMKKEYPNDIDMVNSLKAIANFRGVQAKVKYAEGFHASRYLLDL